MENPQAAHHVFLGNSNQGVNPNHMTPELCLKLSKSLPANQLPGECGALLESARKSGLFGFGNDSASRRRGSSSSSLGSANAISMAWSVEQGHGRRNFAFEEGVDSAKDGASVDEVYTKQLGAQQTEKLRKLRTRMSMRGALNIGGVDISEVEKAKECELQRRKSRKEEIKELVKVYGNDIVEKVRAMP